jgi:hypothetical protein
MGRPFEGEPALRELVIPFGDAGYAALYRFDLAADLVLVLAVRHQREAGISRDQVAPRRKALSQIKSGPTRVR